LTGVLGVAVATGQEDEVGVLEAGVPVPLEIVIGSAPASRSEMPAWKVAETLLGWQRQLSESLGAPVVVKLLDHLTDLGSELDEKPVAVAVLPAAMVPDCGWGRPVFLAENAKGLTSSFLLVAPSRAQIGAGRIPAQVFLVDDTGENSWAGTLWADSLRPGTLERGAQLAGGSAEVVIPIFFGQAEYGLLRADGLAREIAKNPQVEQRVKVVAESPPLLGDVVVMSAELGQDFVEKLRREFASGSGDGAGETLFRHLGWRKFHPVGELELRWIEETCVAVRDGQMARGDDGRDGQAANGINIREERDVE
jgi:hypothetical protein